MTNYRWRIVGLLFVATTINYLDRQVISLLKPTLETIFNWTETDYSHIVMAFQAAYALSYVVFGRLIDKIGTKVGYVLAVLVWSIAAALHAVATSTFSFGVYRALLGLGEGGNFPAAIKTVAEWVQDEQSAVMLRDWGCDYIQGRLIGLASPARPWSGSEAIPAA